MYIPAHFSPDEALVAELLMQGHSQIAVRE